MNRIARGSSTRAGSSTGTINGSDLWVTICFSKAKVYGLNIAIICYRFARRNQGLVPFCCWILVVSRRHDVAKLQGDKNVQLASHLTAMVLHQVKTDVSSWSLYFWFPITCSRHCNVHADLSLCPTCAEHMYHNMMRPRCKIGAHIGPHIFMWCSWLLFIFLLLAWSVFCCDRNLGTKGIAV
jgi:hypothetical protein